MKNILSSSGMPSSMEEGCIRYQLNNNGSTFEAVERIDKCSHLFQIMKIILYVELIFVIGWSGSLLLSHYNNSESSNSMNRQLIESNVGTAVKSSSSRGDSEWLVTISEMEIHRIKRNVEEPQLDREACKTNMNATRARVVSLAAEIVVEEVSDSVIDSRREILVSGILNIFSQHVISWLQKENNTDTKWQLILDELNDQMAQPSNPAIATSSLLSQDNKKKLREIFETLPRLYRQCQEAMGMSYPSADSDREFSAELEIMREKCTRGLNTTQEKTRILATMIVPGEVSNTLVSLQRRNVDVFVRSTALNMIQKIHDKSLIASITDDEWRSELLKIKSNILANSTDSDKELNTNENDSSMQQMAEYLRDIVAWTIQEYPTCITLLRNRGENARSTDEG